VNVVRISGQIYRQVNLPHNAGAAQAKKRVTGGTMHLARHNPSFGGGLSAKVSASLLVLKSAIGVRGHYWA
jgi:hypothetical protein